MKPISYYQLRVCQRYHANQMQDAKREIELRQQFGMKMPAWPQALWSEPK